MADSSQIDRRWVIAACALALAIGVVPMSLWFFSINGRVMDAIAQKKAAPNESVTEIYLFLYACWCGPAFFCLLSIWIQLWKPQIPLIPWFAVWWSAIILFLVFTPTPLFPICIVGLWAATTPGNKALIEAAIRDTTRHDAG